MNYGVATSRAHLDRLDPAARVEGEIAWDLLPGWVPGGGAPKFAGRYFLGVPTQTEADGVPGAGSGFCLWAHGEGADPGAPRLIVPLQRSDPDRQIAVGGTGQTYGTQDAVALAQYIDRCLAVGDIGLSGNGPVLVFLEVDDNVSLSFEYWSAWATAIFEAILYPARFMNRSGVSGVQGLLPAIRCGFKYDNNTEWFLPDPKVQGCLSVVSRTNRRTRCFGFWARRFGGDPGLAQHPFDWSTMGEFEQTGRILVPPLPPLRYRIPVRYLQWFDGPGGWSIPAGTLQDSLALLTLSYSAEGTYDPLPATLTATDWHADRVDTTDNLVEMPVQFGLDKNRDLTRKAACLRAAGVMVSSLPSSSNGLTGGFAGTELASPISGECSLAFRYYSSSDSINKKDMDGKEARSISAAGFHIGVSWEASFSETATIDDLIDHFLTIDRGRKDAVAAFNCAAFVIGQPAYTPVYFAIDFPPGEVYSAGRLMPPLEDVLTYFKNVQQGYREYLRTPGSIPYYVGAYAARNVCEMLYRSGLATHFWQPWPPNWGQLPPDFRGNWKPFPHVNAWQVVIDNTVPEAGRPNLVTENAALFACTSVDIDVAWGDPGTFQVFS